MARLIVAAVASVLLTVAYGVLALTNDELAATLAWLYVLPLLTFLILSKPR